MIITNCRPDQNLFAESSIICQLHTDPAFTQTSPKRCLACHTMLFSGDIQRYWCEAFVVEVDGQQLDVHWSWVVLLWWMVNGAFAHVCDDEDNGFFLLSLLSRSGAAVEANCDKCHDDDVASKPPPKLFILLFHLSISYRSSFVLGENLKKKTPRSRVVWPSPRS